MYDKRLKYCISYSERDTSVCILTFIYTKYTVLWKKFGGKMPGTGKIVFGTLRKNNEAHSIVSNSSLYLLIILFVHPLTSKSMMGVTPRPAVVRQRKRSDATGRKITSKIDQLFSV